LGTKNNKLPKGGFFVLYVIYLFCMPTMSNQENNI